MNSKIKIEKRLKRHRKVRAKIRGTAARPRLCVFRANKHIYGQLVDDDKGETLIAASDRELKKSKSAFEVGKLIAKKANDLKIEKVVFDKGGYKYHGRIKALAEGAREGGLIF